MSRPTEPVVHEGKTFANVDYAERQLENREFIKCIFENCDFSKSDLSYNTFVDCQFNACNFSLAVIEGTQLQNIRFTGCKLLGVNFSKADKLMFSFMFEDCILDYSGFFGRKLRKTRFRNCSLKEVDLENADLTQTVFENCDFEGAMFIHCNLERTDLRSSRNFTIDPSINTMKKTKFLAANLAGLLYKYDLDIEW
jgi:fluoroquinolone resistance protein